MSLALLAALTLAPSRMVAVDGLLIGVYDGKKWSNPEVTTGIPPIYTGEWRKLGSTGVLGSTSFTRALTMQEDTPPGYWLSLETALPGAYYSGPSLRPVKAVSIQSASYKQVLLTYVRKQVKGAKLATFKGMQVDLNGDGRMETILAGGSRPADELRGVTAGGSKPNDFSIVLLRAMVGGKVKEIPINFSKQDAKAYDQGNYLPNVCDLVSVADLDGDGKVEVVTTIDFYEGQSASLWRWDGRKVVTLVENGSGV